MSLFYQSCESTLPSISKDEKGGQFWEKVPQFAVTHDHVMDSLLALAALHLASEQVDRGEIPSWLETALTYQTHATTGLRQDLATNPQNIEASFICSSIILILVTAYPGICWDDAPTDPLSEILTLRSILSGAAFLWIQMVGPERGWLDDWVYREGNNRLVVARAKYVFGSQVPLTSIARILSNKTYFSEDTNLVKLHS